MRPRTRTHGARRIPRTAIAIGVAVFLVLAGTGTASALWSTGPSTLTASATAGTLAFEQSGGNALTKAYAPGQQVDFAPITVRNSGSVPNAFTLRLVATSGNLLGNAVTITGWSIASVSGCTATPPTGTTTTSATLASGITLSGSQLAAGSSVFYCVRTSVDSAATTRKSDPVGINAVLASSIGNWSFAPAAVTVATQSVAPDTTAPTAPTNLTASGTTVTQTTLSWAAATDAFGVTGYRVYRAGIAIATVTSPSYTNTGLVAGTTYNYTVRAFDAANNESADSAGIAVTTPTPWYRIVNPNSGLCIDGDSASTTNGTRLIIWGCAASQNQTWQFVPTTDGFVKVIPYYATTLAWDINIDGGVGMDDYAKANLWSYGGGANQQWKVEQQAGGTVRFVNRNSGKCLDVNGATNVAGTHLQQYTCNGTVAQSWSLTVVG